MLVAPSPIFLLSSVSNPPMSPIQWRTLRSSRVTPNLVWRNDTMGLSSLVLEPTSTGPHTMARFFDDILFSSSFFTTPSSRSSKNMKRSRCHPSRRCTSALALLGSLNSGSGRFAKSRWGSSLYQRLRRVATSWEVHWPMGVPLFRAALLRPTFASSPDTRKMPICWKPPSLSMRRLRATTTYGTRRPWYCTRGRSAGGTPYTGPECLGRGSSFISSSVTSRSMSVHGLGRLKMLIWESPGRR
mmetsp:Transcript_8425/g.21285  ORF Transcript_8425/g.21285 Transcript_8425/m.21285 type:complete len:243 (-) Transcript_8425:475-1203(-)